MYYIWSEKGIVERIRRELPSILLILLVIAALFAFFAWLQKDTAITNIGSYIGDFVLILVLFAFTLWYINRFLYKKKQGLVYSAIRLIQKVHVFIGLIIWLFISIHGFYFLFVSDLRYSPGHIHHMTHAIQTGITAYILLVLLIVMGVLQKKSPGKLWKRLHRIAANLLLFIVYLHIGGWLKMLLALILFSHWVFLVFHTVSSKKRFSKRKSDLSL